MFAKSRRRIVAAVTMALAVLFAVTAAVISGFSWTELRRRGEEMLEHYAALYTVESPPGSGMGPERGSTPPEPPDDSHEPLYALSTFYSAAFSEEGEVLAVDEGRGGVYARETIIGIARDILESGKEKGRRGQLLYLTAGKDGYTLVALMDNTVTDQSFRTLFRWTLIAEGAALILLSLLSVKLADAIVNPLEENDLRQRQFISDAGHELKTPVAVISSNAEVLSRQIGDSEWLDNIRYESERMGDLVTQLLELSRAENMKVPPEPVDFSRVVTGEALAFESVAFERGMVIRSKVQEGIVVNGNPSRLAQVVSILLDNAVRHAEEDPEISVILKKEGHTASLRVENGAAEIPAGSLDLLFERFRRGSEAREEAEGHYGLGLAIAKAVVQSHRGTIAADWHDGRIVFTVILPAEK